MDPTDYFGTAAAIITTLCWLPQAVHILRAKEASGVSWLAYGSFAVGIACWLIYGLLLRSWPLIGANTVTLTLVLAILYMKLHYARRKMH